jgi:predicted dehydrogenase
METGAMLDLTGIHVSEDPLKTIHDPEVHLVSICTPTDTHVQFALAALAAGKHVLIEKPVALTAPEVMPLVSAAATSGLLCMPAMCMRFWPGWNWLADRIRERTFGRVLSATFQRLGTTPEWNQSFYGDLSRSGGALVDLHIHDVDFLLWCFGQPREVVSIGSARHVTTLYRFDPSKGHHPDLHVVAEGGQDHTPGFGFRMRYSVTFESATAEFDLSRSPQLLLYRDGGAQPIPTDGPSGYESEVVHIVDAVLNRQPPSHLLATVADALAVAHVLDAERRSLATSAPERPLHPQE